MIALFGSGFWSNTEEVTVDTLTLRDPEEVRIANSYREVIPLLRTAEAAALSGKWVAVLISYEAAPAFDKAFSVHDGGDFPLACSISFTKANVEHRTQTESSHITAPTASLTRSQYGSAVAKIRELIARGDTYQVNYTFPLVAPLTDRPQLWYYQLLEAQPVRYNAYLDLGRFKIMSLSPEMFFSRQGRRASTRPMKGTIRRGRWEEEDKELAHQLSGSQKERAENVMIVDLLRNDLGRVSIPGSVKVEELFRLERYETLWQMTSTITSQLESETGLAELMTALFPCGSVTGAPKIRTMQIIRDLEPLPRQIYTGAIGLLKPGGDCLFNVAIRTLLVDTQTEQVIFGVGSGITFDSNAESEYDECLLKTSFLKESRREFDLLESILLESGDFFLLDRHLARAASSARYFGFSWNETKVLAVLARMAHDHSQGSWKVRLLSSQDGHVSVDASALDSKPPIMRVALAREPVNSHNRFLFHKTTNRADYEKELQARPDCDDIIFWNERGEITESAIANVVLSIDGKQITPPRSAGLLAGVLREELLAQAQLQEQTITKEQLQHAGDFHLINSVRKWMTAKLVA